MTSDRPTSPECQSARSWGGHATWLCLNKHVRINRISRRNESGKMGKALACVLLVDDCASSPVEELHGIEHRLVEDGLRGKDVYWKLFISLVAISIQMCLDVRNVQCSSRRLDVIAQCLLGRNNWYRPVFKLRANCIGIEKIAMRIGEERFVHRSSFFGLIEKHRISCPPPGKWERGTQE